MPGRQRNGLFVLVSHLDPGHVSLLTEIIQRVTAMPVLEAVDQLEVEPNHVYVIPPNLGHGDSSPETAVEEPAGPRGCACRWITRVRWRQHQQETRSESSRGTGSDGTLGLRVSGAGGVTPRPGAPAPTDGMPSSAIRVVAMSPMCFPSTKCRRPAGLVLGASPCRLKRRRSLAAGWRLESHPDAIAHDDRPRFLALQKSTVGAASRAACRCTRSTTPMSISVEENPAEVARLLFKEPLIERDQFFSSRTLSCCCKENSAGAVESGQSGDFVFRVWVAGCRHRRSLFNRHFVARIDGTRRRAFKVQIYSTDLADAGHCALPPCGTLSAEYRPGCEPRAAARFFVREEGGYRIKKEVREMIVFAVQNVIKDPPFTRLDLLCCRNLMILSRARVAESASGFLHYALKPGGVLFLSPSESIGNHTELFSSIDRKWKLYRTNPSLLTSFCCHVPGRPGLRRGRQNTG